MKKITITVDVDGNSVSRSYIYSETMEAQDWDGWIGDMLDTIQKSEEPLAERKRTSDHGIMKQVDNHTFLK